MLCASGTPPTIARGDAPAWRDLFERAECCVACCCGVGATSRGAPWPGPLGLVLLTSTWVRGHGASRLPAHRSRGAAPSAGGIAPHNRRHSSAELERRSRRVALTAAHSCRACKWKARVRLRRASVVLRYGVLSPKSRGKYSPPAPRCPKIIESTHEEAERVVQQKVAFG